MGKIKRELIVVPVTHFVSRKSLKSKWKFLYDDLYLLFTHSLDKLGYDDEWFRVSEDGCKWMQMLEKKRYHSLATFEETIAAIAYLACNNNMITISLDDIKDKLGLEEKYVAEEVLNIIRVLELDKSIFEEQFPVMLNLDIYLNPKLSSP